MAKENNRRSGERKHCEQSNVNKMKSVQRTRRKGIMERKMNTLKKNTDTYIRNWGGKLGSPVKVLLKQEI